MPSNSILLLDVAGSRFLQPLVVPASRSISLDDEPGNVTRQPIGGHKPPETPNTQQWQQQWQELLFGRNCSTCSPFTQAVIAGLQSCLCPRNDDNAALLVFNSWCAVAVDHGMQGKRSLYLGAVGGGARMKLVVNMIMGSMMGEQQAGTGLMNAALLVLIRSSATAARLHLPCTSSGQHTSHQPCRVTRGVVEM